MKIKCINNDDFKYGLTVGKTYEVIEYDKEGYKIINDRNIENWYIEERFKKLSEIRNETINKLLE